MVATTTFITSITYVFPWHVHPLWLLEPLWNVFIFALKNLNKLVVYALNRPYTIWSIYGLSRFYVLWRLCDMCNLYDLSNLKNVGFYLLHNLYDKHRLLYLCNIHSLNNQVLYYLSRMKVLITSAVLLSIAYSIICVSSKTYIMSVDSFISISIVVPVVSLVYVSSWNCASLLTHGSSVTECYLWCSQPLWGS